MCSAKALADVVLIKLNLKQFARNHFGGHSMRALMHYVMRLGNYLITPRQMDRLSVLDFLTLQCSSVHWWLVHYCTDYFAPTLQRHLHHLIGCHPLTAASSHYKSMSSLCSSIDKIYPITNSFTNASSFRAKLLIWHSIHTVNSKWTCRVTHIFLYFISLIN